jgi:uncharacterized membrane protein YfcA
MQWTDPLVITELLAAGVVAGYLNVLAGGGSLLVVPLLIFLGLPEGVANGTSRLAIAVQALAAVLKYRAEGRINVPLARAVVPPALLGALAGALCATRLSNGAFRSILTWVMIVCAAFVVVEPFLFRSGARAPRSEPVLSPPKTWLTMGIVGFYGGMIQAGMGYVQLCGSVLVLGIALIEASILKMVVVACYAPFALAIFAANGMVHWRAGLLLAVGQGCGAWLGAHAALRFGERLVRAALAAVVVLSAIKLCW